MLATVLIVGLALLWLMRETDYLRTRLLAYESIENYDKRILSQMEQEQIIEDAKYQAWLDKRHAPKLVYGSSLEPAYADNPQDKWMAIEENLLARREGRMIYQRGSWR